MANYANLLATIAANIYENHGNQVTANMVKAACDYMVASLGAGYQFAGVATSATDPGTPDQKVFYLAVEPGTYANFDGAVLGGDAVCVFYYSSAWSHSLVPISMMRAALPTGDLNDVKTSGTYILSSAESYTHTPNNYGTGFLRVSEVEQGRWWLQEVYQFSGNGYWVRRSEAGGATWGDWKGINIGGDVMNMRGILPSQDLNNLTDTGTWLLVDTNTYQNAPTGARSGFIRVSKVGGYSLQEFFSFSGSSIYTRRAGQTWSRHDNPMGILPTGDLNGVTSIGTWLLSDANTYQHVPNNAHVGFLRVSVMSNWVLQEFFAFSQASLYKRKFTTSTAPENVEDWQIISGGGNVYNITNNYTFPEYSNVYNVTATPTITTDTNNYLASTGDTTDRTTAIAALLASTGVCHLGPGNFYVDGLEMPDDTTLTGCGGATKVILASGSNKYAVKMGKRCAVKDIHFAGSVSTITPSASVGTRHGILWQGNYTQTSDNSQQPQNGIVSGCRFTSFAGGGITFYDTGYSSICQMEVSDCYMSNCDVGIYISYWSEFHKFTNVRTAGCYYGCVNNGGNNVFVNCDFSSCKEGFLMDNSQGQSPNNSHGSAIGCVFNHTDANTGVGIRVLNCANGFIFSGCQIFYSQIVLEDSDGVVFQGCNFGKNNCDITITNGGAELFANNMHEGAPTISITNNSNVHFVNCYNRSTGAPISA